MLQSRILATTPGGLALLVTCEDCVTFCFNSYKTCSPSWVTNIHTHTHTHIYIYIVIHRQTVSFYQNSSVWLDTWDVWRWDGNPSNFTLDLVSDWSANKRTTLAKGIYQVLCSNSSSVHLFTFLYPIGYQSAQFFQRALHYVSGSRKFLRQSAQLDAMGKLSCELYKKWKWNWYLTLPDIFTKIRLNYLEIL